jgi:hypothetical protein
MPTENPRVNVTLSPSLDSLVARLAKLQRVSKSTVLRELLEAAEPSLRSVVALMEAAQGASVKARTDLVRDLEQSVQAAKTVQHLALSVAANHTRDMVSEAEAIRGRRPQRGTRSGPPGGAVPGSLQRASRLRKDPPPSNRGVKS